MNRTAALVGALFCAFGLAVFGWKALALDLPLVPSGTEGLWSVELEITVRGSGRNGSVRVAMGTEDERFLTSTWTPRRDGQEGAGRGFRTDRLDDEERLEDGQRLLVWSGRFAGVRVLSYRFRVQTRERVEELPTRWTTEPPDSLRSELFVTPELPIDDRSVTEVLETLRIAEEPDLVGRFFKIYGFVSGEIAGAPTASADAILTLVAREGNDAGKTRLLVTLLRAAGIPARTVAGLELRDDGPPELVPWAEAWLGSWIPVSAVDGFVGTRPSNLVPLRAGELSLVETTGLDAVGYRYHALREQLTATELQVMMRPKSGILQDVSLYRLPVATQATLRTLLLLPLGALVTALFRNLVGVPTFGTFMPALVALALRGAALGPGLLLVVTVLTIAVVARLGLDRLRLLMVPRLSILLAIVVLSVTALALFAETRELQAFVGGALLPMVILTMLAERFSITLAEEGLWTAMVRAFWSTAIAVAVYPLYRSAQVEHLLFGFPELTFVIIGVLVWVGAYTGYRVMDLWRFRSLAGT